MSLILNAVAVASPNFLLSRIAETLGKDQSSPSDVVEKVLSRKTLKPPLILVLDEIDFLLQGKDYSAADKSLLNTILNWASKPSYKLILIGISNSVGNTLAKRIQNVVKVRTTETTTSNL